METYAFEQEGRAVDGDVCGSVVWQRGPGFAIGRTFCPGREEVGSIAKDAIVGFEVELFAGLRERKTEIDVVVDIFEEFVGCEVGIDEAVDYVSDFFWQP